MSNAGPTAIDINGYVAPAMELVYERSTAELRGQWLDIERRLALTRPIPGIGDWVAPYLRLVADDVEVGDLGPPRLPPHGAIFPGIEPGVLQDRPRARLRAMGMAGIGIQLINPTPGIDYADRLESNLTAGIFAAYNQYVTTYCEEDPARLRAVIQVHGLEPQWSALEVRELAAHASVAAVTIHLPVRMAPDDPSLTQLWGAVEETGLPVLHRPGAVSRIWWGARHLLMYLGQAGVLDRHPALRFLFVDQGLRGVLPPPSAGGAPSQALLRSLFEAGRIGFGIDGDEPDDLLEAAIAEIGHDCLVWQSSFPFLSHASVPSFPLLARESWASRLRENADRLVTGSSGFAFAETGTTGQP
jgi:hypothetical protein